MANNPSKVTLLDRSGKEILSVTGVYSRRLQQLLLDLFDRALK
jgi:hypothetical protein